MSIRVSEEQGNKEPKESTGEVSAKDPLNVKPVIEEFPKTQKCEN